MTSRRLNDGDEIARVCIPPCEGCGGTNWEQDGDLWACRACGECYENIDRKERVLTPDEGYVRVQEFGRKRLATGGEHIFFRISTGRDDQRPEHDPDAGIYRPICVEQHLDGPGSSIYTYLKYCGKCRRKWGSLGESGSWTHCPHCAAVIGNYVFADGTEHWYPDRTARWGDPGASPPEAWPAA